MLYTDIIITDLAIYLANNDIKVYNESVVCYKDYLYPYIFANDIDTNIEYIVEFNKKSDAITRKVIAEIIVVLEIYSRKEKIKSLNL